jgi:hypothetical protein
MPPVQHKAASSGAEARRGCVGLLRGLNPPPPSGKNPPALSRPENNRRSFDSAALRSG